MSEKTHYLLLAVPLESHGALVDAANHPAIRESDNPGDPAPFPAFRDGEQWGWWSAAAVGETTVTMAPAIAAGVPGVIYSVVPISEFPPDAVVDFLTANNLNRGW